MTIAINGYTFAAVGFALLGLLVLVFWRDRQALSWLIAAIGLSLAWLIAVFLQSGDSDPFLEWRLLLELARNAGWLLYLLALYAALRASPRQVVLIRLLVFATLLFAALICDIFGPVIPGASLQAGYAYLGIASAIGVLMLAEQVLRNAPRNARWAIKYLCFALFVTFGFDLFFYARLMLDGEPNATLDQARGFVIALSLAPMALALRRNPQWSLDGVVSHQVVFYTAALTGVGLYLVVIGIAGSYIQAFGGSWGDVAQVVFFAAAAVGLCAVLFSSTIRAQLSVYLRKNFFRFKYDYRIEWLRFSKTLSDNALKTIPERAIKAIAQIVDSPGGVLWVRSGVQQSFLPEAAWECSLRPDDRIAVTEPVMDVMLKRGWIINLFEHRRNPEIYNDAPVPALFQQAGVWLLVPLTTNERLQGFVSLLAPEVVPTLNFEDHDLLRTMGGHVATHMRQLQAEQRVTEGRQFDTFSRLSAFMMHDISNILAQLSMVVQNAEKHKGNPEFVDDMVNTVSGSVARMERLLGQLRGGDSDVERVVSLAELAQDAAERCQLRRPAALVGQLDRSLLVKVDRGRFVRILEHLLRNAQEATNDDGSVEISCSALSGFAVVRVSDTGIGMTPAFVNEVLFKPFQSTKGSQGMGIGAFQALEYVRQLGGDIDVESEVDVGTVISLMLPKTDEV
ncbi:MAG: XrtA/PEP-CTERM system histidine kinase PrsK [Pseudomonadota bacterium]